MAKATDLVKFEFEGITFEAVKSEMESYETNKQLAVGGVQFYQAVGRIFAGRDVEYSKKLDGTYDSVVALVNAAFAENAKAKN